MFPDSEGVDDPVLVVDEASIGATDVEDDEAATPAALLFTLPLLPPEKYSENLNSSEKIRRLKRKSNDAIFDRLNWTHQILEIHCPKVKVNVWFKCA